MIKLIYKGDPFYFNDGSINEPCTTNVEIDIEDSASAVEVLAQVVKLLEVAGYSKQHKSTWLRFVEDLAYNGYLIKDTED